MKLTKKQEQTLEQGFLLAFATVSLKKGMINSSEYRKIEKAIKREK